MRKWKVLSLLMIFSLFLVNPVTAQQVNLDYNDIADDSKVWSSNPTTNYGTASLGVGTASGTEITYIKWDLSNVPSGSTIHDASMCVRKAGGSQPLDVGVHEVDDDGWNEGTVTWNNQPCGTAFTDPDCNLTAEEIRTVTVLVGYECWNVTTMLQSQLSSGELSVVMKENTSSGNAVGINSKETGTTVQRPYMNITYSGGSPSGAGGDVPTLPPGAIAINDCGFQLNVSGTPSSAQWYYLSSNLYTDINDVSSNPNYCILADGVSNWVLSLNGYSISDSFDIGAGVYVDNASNFTIGWGEINSWGAGSTGCTQSLGAGAITLFGNPITPDIIDGAINNMQFSDNEMSINVEGTDGLDITDNHIDGTGLGAICIRDSQDIDISNQNMTEYSGQYGIYAEDIFNIDVTSIETGYVTGYDECCEEDTVWIYGVPFTVSSCGEFCSGTSLSPNVAVACVSCDNSTFSANTLFAGADFLLNDDSDYNTFVYNTFVRKSGQGANGLFIGTDADNNYGCGNIGSVFDADPTGNNVFDAFCPQSITGGLSCTAGWYCTDTDTISYIGEDCQTSDYIYCNPYACVEDGNSSYCQGFDVGQSPSVTTIDTTDYIIQFEQSTLDDLEEAGIDWVLFFLTKFFWFSMIMLAIAGVFSYFIPESAKVVFPIVVTLFSAGYTLSGIYPFAVGIVIVIIAGFISVKMLGETFGIGR